MSNQIKIWNESRNISSYLSSYLIDSDLPRPAVLILPGGGYQMVCAPSEGEPVAKKFNSLGLHAFVLNYRVYPDTFPAPQQDAMRALKIIRGNAEKWHIAPNKIGSCGFSAGGNLSASLGTTMVDDIDASDGDRYDRYSSRPDFIIAGQGVLSFADNCRVTTARNLLGHDADDEKIMKFSPDMCVSSKTPPTFLWHTFFDQVVDYNCSIRFAQALRKHNVHCELHIFPQGDHGILLGVDTPDVSQWPALAKNFIETVTAENPAPREYYTHLHQCEATGTYPGPWKNGQKK